MCLFLDLQRETAVNTLRLIQHLFHTLTFTQNLGH